MNNEEGDVVAINAPSKQLLNEANWFQQLKANSTFEQLRLLLVECCLRLNASDKLAGLPELPPQAMKSTTPTIEKFSLLPRSGQESLSAIITLSGEKVIHAEVSLKYAKSASGFYRATSQPEVHWKMQQLQDAANLTVRALRSFCRCYKTYNECMQKGVESEEALRYFLLSMFNAIKEDIKMARSVLTMPKKKSLVDLCNFHPIKSFVPPLPHDILLSFYISSAKLVCAAYQVAVAPSTIRNRDQQTVTIYQAECQVPRLNDIVALLNTAFAISHEFVSSYSLLLNAQAASP